MIIWNNGYGFYHYDRKLCIFKGVFPREPKKKVKGNHHTYYHLKDVAFLHHEPLLEKFRDIRAYEKKISKADAKKNKERANFLKEHRPTYVLDRIIRERFVQLFRSFFPPTEWIKFFVFIAHNELFPIVACYAWPSRYPKFIDALRDLDDCLSMVHLFAALPAQERLKVEAKRIHNCRRLVFTGLSKFLWSTNMCCQLVLYYWHGNKLMTSISHHLYSFYIFC